MIIWKKGAVNHKNLGRGFFASPIIYACHSACRSKINRGIWSNNCNYGTPRDRLRVKAGLTPWGRTSARACFKCKSFRLAIKCRIKNSSRRVLSRSAGHLKRAAAIKCSISRLLRQIDAVESWALGPCCQWGEVLAYLPEVETVRGL